MRALNIILLLLLAMLQYRLWAGEGSISHYASLQQRIDQQQQVNDQLAARHARLSAEVLDLQHGTDGIEEYARMQLGMIKPGETFFLVVNRNSP